MVSATNDQLALEFNCALCSKNPCGQGAIAHGENETFHLIHKSCMKVAAEYFDSCPVEGCSEHIDKKDLFTWKDRVSLMSRDAKILAYSSLFKISLPLGFAAITSIVRIYCNLRTIHRLSLKEFALVGASGFAGAGLGVGIAAKLGAGFIGQTALGIIFGGAIDTLVADYLLNQWLKKFDNDTNELIMKHWDKPGAPPLSVTKPTILPEILNALKESYSGTNQMLNDIWRASQEDVLKKLHPDANEEVGE